MSATKSAECENNTNIDFQSVERDLLNRHTARVCGLGMAAVRANIEKSGYLARGEKVPKIDDMVAKHQIKEARKTMQSEPSFAIKFCEINHDKISPWLKTVTGNTPAEMVNHLLANKKAGKYKIKDKTFLNFLDWYNHANLQRQNESADLINERKILFKSQIEKVVNDGWMPKSVLDDGPEKLSAVAVEVDDGYELLKCQDKQAAEEGFYLNGVFNDNVLGNPWMLLRSIAVKSSTFIHESVHAVTGYGDYYDYCDSAKEINGYVISVGSMGKIFDGDGKTIIDETITEHVTQSLLHGSVDIIKPAKKTASYYEFRMLLDALCNQGAEKIDIREFIAAYFEDDKTARQLNVKSARNILIAHLRKAFPSGDIITEINKLKIVGGVHIESDSLSAITDLNK